MLFKNDFVNNLNSNPQEIKFSSDTVRLNSYEAFDYYYNSVIVNVNKDNLCAFICNSSIDSTIISFFLILDDIKIIFLSSDQSEKDINNVLKKIKINELIFFDKQPINKKINFLII